MRLLSVAFIGAGGCAGAGDLRVPSDPALGELAAAIVANELTDEEFEDLGLNDDELRELMIEVGVLVGGDREELEDEVYGGQAEQPLLRGACSQNVEKANASGDTYSYSHVQSSTCDGDPSDVDWVYNFGPAWADDSNDIRWYAGSYVRSVFDVTYGGNLLGPALCSSPVQLCIGTNGVSLAGGANAVAASLFISHY